MVYMIQPTFNHPQLLAKSTVTHPTLLANATHVSPLALGCSPEEADTVIRRSINDLRNMMDTKPETVFERREVLIGLRSGKEVSFADEINEESSNPDSHEVTSALTDSPDHPDSRTLRSGRTIDTSLPEPIEAQSTQYVPPEAPIATATPTKVPPLRRWVGYQTRHQTFSQKQKDQFKTDLPGYPAGLQFLQ